MMNLGSKQHIGARPGDIRCTHDGGVAEELSLAGWTRGAAAKASQSHKTQSRRTTNNTCLAKEWGLNNPRLAQV